MILIGGNSKRRLNAPVTINFYLNTYSTWRGAVGGEE
jgi:hypothetical protein